MTILINVSINVEGEMWLRDFQCEMLMKKGFSH